MRGVSLMLVIGCMALTASGVGAVASSPAVSSTAPTPSSSRTTVTDRAEIERLKKAVAQQEADSEQADDRLEQQDQAIAELQKQLQALREGQADDTP